MKNYTFQT